MDEDQNKQNEINEIKEEKTKESKEIELLKQEIRKQNELIKSLHKENQELIQKNEENIYLVNQELLKTKLVNQKEMNALKEFFIKEINLLKEEISKNKDEDKNDKNEVEEKKRKFQLKTIKEQINDLNDKFNKFGRTFDNKLDFIESSLSKLMEANNIKLDISKEFEKKLYDIFKEDNDYKENIDPKDLEEFKNLGKTMMENGGPSPLELTRNFFDNKIYNRISELKEQKIIINIISKKDKIFMCLDNLELGLNFNIDKFRKDFNLSKEDYSDEFLISIYKENKCDKNKTFKAIIEKKFK